MKKIIFVFFILYSCTQVSENTMLERCIDANIYKNDWISKKIKYFESRGQRDWNKPSSAESTKELASRMKVFYESLNELENEIDDCIYKKTLPLQYNDDYFELYETKMTPELELFHNQCELEVGDKYFINVEYAAKICNSQGVY